MRTKTLIIIGKLESKKEKSKSFEVENAQIQIYHIKWKWIYLDEVQDKINTLIDMVIFFIFIFI